MMAKLLRVDEPEQTIGLTNKEYFSKRVASNMNKDDRTTLETGDPIVTKLNQFEQRGVM